MEGVLMDKVRESRKKRYMYWYLKTLNNETDYEDYCKSNKKRRKYYES